MGPAATALEALREQRHRFLNHLQVLSGWLQLGDPAQASRYLARAVAELQTEGQLSRLEPPELALALIRAHWAALDLGVEVSWHLNSPPPGPLPAHLGARVGSLVQRAALAVARQPDPRLSVGIGARPGGWDLVLRGPGLLADPELQALAGELREAGPSVRLEEPAPGAGGPRF